MAQLYRDELAEIEYRVLPLGDGNAFRLAHVHWMHLDVRGRQTDDQQQQQQLLGCVRTATTLVGHPDCAEVDVVPRTASSTDFVQAVRDNQSVHVVRLYSGTGVTRKQVGTWLAHQTHVHHCELVCTEDWGWATTDFMRDAHHGLSAAIAWNNYAAHLTVLKLPNTNGFRLQRLPLTLRVLTVGMPYTCNKEFGAWMEKCKLRELNVITENVSDRSDCVDALVRGVLSGAELLEKFTLDMPPQCASTPHYWSKSYLNLLGLLFKWGLREVKIPAMVYSREYEDDYMQRSCESPVPPIVPGVETMCAALTDSRCALEKLHLVFYVVRTACMNKLVQKLLCANHSLVELTVEEWQNVSVSVDAERVRTDLAIIETCGKTGSGLYFSRYFTFDLIAHSLRFGHRADVDDSLSSVANKYYLRLTSLDIATYWGGRSFAENLVKLMERCCLLTRLNVRLDARAVMYVMLHVPKQLSSLPLYMIAVEGFECFEPVLTLTLTQLVKLKLQVHADEALVERFVRQLAAQIPRNYRLLEVSAKNHRWVSTAPAPAEYAAILAACDRNERILAQANDYCDVRLGRRQQNNNNKVVQSVSL